MSEAAPLHMTSGQAQLRSSNGALVVVLSGDWSLEEKIPRFEAVMADRAQAVEPTSALTFESDELGSWDSSLLVFLEQAQSYCNAQQIRMDESGLP